MPPFINSLFSGQAFPVNEFYDDWASSESLASRVQYSRSEKTASFVLYILDNGVPLSDAQLLLTASPGIFVSGAVV